MSKYFCREKLQMSKYFPWRLLESFKLFFVLAANELENDTKLTEGCLLKFYRFICRIVSLVITPTSVT